MLFYKLANGARFEFFGVEYQKCGMGCAEDARRIGHVFQARAEVTPIGEPLLLPEAEAALWDRDDSNWSARLVPAPGPHKFSRVVP